VCKAQVENGPQCRRCRADLALLFTLEWQRAQALAAARTAIARGQGSEAIAAAERADELRHGPDACSLRALGHLLERDFAGAWRTYLKSRRSPSVAREPGSRDNG
jgi:Flp pilus assembly protein TadD